MKIWERRVNICRGVTGPRHDPYSFEIVTVTVNGLDIEFWSCGLRGEGFRVHDTLGETRRPPTVRWDFEVYGGEAVQAARRDFVGFTGASPEQFVKWYYTRLYEPDPMTEYYGGMGSII